MKASNSDECCAYMIYSGWHVLMIDLINYGLKFDKLLNSYDGWWFSEKIQVFSFIWKLILSLLEMSTSVCTVNCN